MLTINDYEKPLTFIERRIIKLKNQLVYSQLDEIFKDQINLNKITESVDSLEEEVRRLSKQLDLQTRDLSDEEYDVISSEHTKIDNSILRVQHKVWAVQSLIRMIEDLKEKWKSEDTFGEEGIIEISEKLTIKRLLI